MSDDDDFDERRLVERVIAGQPGADEEFIDRYGPVVVRVLRRFRVSQQDRDDWFQDVFKKLWDKDKARLKAWLKAWRPGNCLSSYIAVTANNHAKDMLLSRTFLKDGLRNMREVPLEEGFDPAGDPAHGGETIGSPRERIVFQVARKCLTPREFEICELIRRGEKADQIGQALNMTRNNVDVARNRMIRRLRKCLKERGLWPL